MADATWTAEAHEQYWWSIVLPDGTPRPAYLALKGNAQIAMFWILVLSYWIHLLSTVVWFGSLVLMGLAAWPARQKGVVADNSWLTLQKRLTPWANVSLILLLITGFVQMTNDANYSGFLSHRQRVGLGDVGQARSLWVAGGCHRLFAVWPVSGDGPAGAAGRKTAESGPNRTV
jgi:hypothetical protein